MLRRNGIMLSEVDLSLSRRSKRVAKSTHRVRNEPSKEKERGRVQAAKDECSCTNPSAVHQVRSMLGGMKLTSVGMIICRVPFAYGRLRLLQTHRQPFLFPVSRCFRKLLLLVLPILQDQRTANPGPWHPSGGSPNSGSGSGKHSMWQ